MRPFFHPLWCSVMAMCLLSQGCVTSTHVSAIGARIQTGSAEVADETMPCRIAVTDSKRVPASIENSGLSIPFVTLSPQEPGTILGDAWLVPAEIAWAETKAYGKNGRVSVELLEETKEFHVTAVGHGTKDLKTDEVLYLHIEHRYRRWYGYPAQVLLVGAVPIDAVIVTGSLVMGIFDRIFSWIIP